MKNQSEKGNGGTNERPYAIMADPPFRSFQIDKQRSIDMFSYKNVIQGAFFYGGM